MASTKALQKAAQAWCTPETEKIVMNPKSVEALVEAFADIIDEIWEQQRKRDIRIIPNFKPLK